MHLLSEVVSNSLATWLANSESSLSEHQDLVKPSIGGLYIPCHEPGTRLAWYEQTFASALSKTHS